jgi:hypothetical protein
MKTNKRLLRAEGFTEAEIQRFTDRWRAAVRGNRFDYTAVVYFSLRTNDWFFVSKGAAEILHDIRPECRYLEIPNLAELLNL